MAPLPVQLNENNSEVSAKLLIAQLLIYLEGCDKDPMIKVAAVYKTPLDHRTNRVSSGYHTNVYFMIKGYHLTIDKENDGLTIQVSRSKDKVLQKLRKEPRKDLPELIVHDEANIKLKKLIKFIVEKNFTQENYDDWKKMHCKKFSKDIFDRAAKIMKYNWKEGETNARDTDKINCWNCLRN